jgi:hypothetical protein
LQVLDLRSQQVRDTCQFLMRLAEVTGERMKPFLRDSFATILEGAKIPHKVTSGYIDECIIHLIKHVTFKGAIVLIMHEIKESKSKAMREHCLVSCTLCNTVDVFKPHIDIVLISCLCRNI